MRITLIALITAVCMSIFIGCHPDKQSAGSLTLAVGGSPGELVFWQELIEEFESKTSIKIDLLRQPSDTDLRRQGLVAALRSKSSKPDIFLMDIAWLSQFAYSDWLEGLDKYIASSELKPQNFFSGAINLARVSGKIVALPVFVDGGVLYYRKDLLDEFGFEPPQTWDQLLTQAQTVQQLQQQKNPNFIGFVWQGAQYEGLICNWLEFLGEGDDRGITISPDKVSIHNSANADATVFMHELISKYRISPLNTFTEMREEPCRIFFQQGNALFERNWPYAWSLHQALDSPVKGKIAIAAMPRWPDGRSVSTMGGWLVGISKFSKQKDDSFAFCRFLCSYEIQKKLALKLGLNPARTDVYKDSEIIEKFPHFEKLRTIFENLKSRPNLPYYSLVSEILQRNINAVLSGRSSADEALKTSEQQITKLIRRYEQ